MEFKTRIKRFCEAVSDITILRSNVLVAMGEPPFIVLQRLYFLFLLYAIHAKNAIAWPNEFSGTSALCDGHEEVVGEDFGEHAVEFVEQFVGVDAFALVARGD